VSKITFDFLLIAAPARRPRVNPLGPPGLSSGDPFIAAYNPTAIPFQRREAIVHPNTLATSRSVMANTSPLGMLWPEIEAVFSAPSGGGGLQPTLTIVAGS
jgi:hypothetical protein